MAVDLKPQVIRVSPSPLLTRTGGVTQRTSVEYMVGEHGPFTILLPDSEFSAAKVKELMEKKAVELRALMS